jgi:transcriptional regulator with XRE-family HTH domain
MPELSPSPVGRLLREWRAARGHSQLNLALHAGISTRHLSFIETGRASPSREMVLLLAQALEMPLRERNALLMAAGFAPVFSETSLDAPEMESVRRALDAILRAHAHSPTIVVNRFCDVLMANEAATRLMARLLPPEALPHTSNMIRLIFSPEGARPFIANWDEVAAQTIVRLRRESPTQGEDPLRAILGPEVALPDAATLRAAMAPERPPPIALPIRWRRGDIALDLFSTVTTLGTPFDITVQELRIESMFAADRASEDKLKALLNGPG